MKYSKQLLLATTLLASSMSQASIIDFADLANTIPGEGGYYPFTTSVDGITVSAYGAAAGPVAAWAYLDSNTGGLGVCKATDTGSGGDCVPSNDDNISTGEYLTFSFDKTVIINTLWFNNNHDGGFGETGKLIDIGVGSVSAYAVYESTKANGIAGSWVVNPGDNFYVAYDFIGGCGGDEEYTYDRAEDCGTQFYVEKMEFTQPTPTQTGVPEPGSLALLGLGVIGLSFMRRRWA